MMCVATDYVIVCLDSIDDKKQRKNVSSFIKESGKKLIEISEKQVESFAGNMLELVNDKGESILVMSSRRVPLARKLSSFPAKEESIKN